MNKDLEELESIRLNQIRENLNPLMNNNKETTKSKSINLRLKKKGLASILRETFGKEDYKELTENFRLGRK